MSLWFAKPSAMKPPQCTTLVHGDMVGLVAFDLILRIALARMMYVTLVVHIALVHPHDPTGDQSSFGIPTDMIADLEYLCHGNSRDPIDRLVRSMLCRY